MLRTQREELWRDIESNKRMLGEVKREGEDRKRTLQGLVEGWTGRVKEGLEGLGEEVNRLRVEWGEWQAHSQATSIQWREAVRAEWNKTIDTQTQVNNTLQNRID